MIGTIRSCKHCSQPFVASRGIHVHCSKQCRDRAYLEANREEHNSRNAMRRALERGAQASDQPFTRTDVLDRDGWICQLCLAPIDWRLRGRNPLAPSVDHIVPLHAGGTHELSNVWAAHFGCNASKSARVDVTLLPVPRAALAGA